MITILVCWLLLGLTVVATVLGAIAPVQTLAFVPVPVPVSEKMPQNLGRYRC